MTEEKKVWNIGNQTSAGTTDVSERAEIILQGDDRTSFAIDWMKVDWGIQRYADNGLRGYVFLVKEPLGGAELTTLQALEERIVWYDGKYVLSTGVTSESAFFVMSDPEQYVNFLPDETFDIDDGEQLSIYVMTMNASGSTTFYMDYLIKFILDRNQINHPNDNAFIDTTFEESLAGWL